jgi:uncharacterized membrane-anchored protein
MLEIKKIKKISLANTTAFICAVLSFLAVFGFYSYALIIALKTGQTADPLYKFILFNVSLGVASGLFVAFLIGLASWLIGLIISGLYNIIAAKSGGLKIEIDGLAKEQVEEKKQEELFPF